MMMAEIEQIRKTREEDAGHELSEKAVMHGACYIPNKDKMLKLFSHWDLDWLYDEVCQELPYFAMGEDYFWPFNRLCCENMHSELVFSDIKIHSKCEYIWPGNCAWWRTTYTEEELDYSLRDHSLWYLRGDCFEKEIAQYFQNRDNHMND